VPSIRSFSTRHLLQSLFVLGCLLAAVPTRSQTQCAVTCSPNPTSSTYTGGTFGARWALWNLRRGGPFAPPIRPPSHGGGGSHAHGNTGASTYDYAVPILSLPGRNGLDVNLTLFYSSRVWILDTVNNRMTFNADRDFPSHGFRLGYGYVEQSGGNVLLTEPDGAKRQLQLVSGSTTMFTTVDSTYITWDNTNIFLREKTERDGFMPRLRQALRRFLRLARLKTRMETLSLSRTRRPQGMTRNRSTQSRTQWEGWSRSITTRARNSPRLA
jgi:hypothetical protein